MDSQASVNRKTRIVLAVCIVFFIFMAFLFYFIKDWGKWVWISGAIGSGVLALVCAFLMWKVDWANKLKDRVMPSQGGVFSGMHGGCGCEGGADINELLSER